MEPDNLPVPYRAHVTAPAPCGHPYSAVRRGRVPPCSRRRLAAATVPEQAGGDAGFGGLRLPELRTLRRDAQRDEADLSYVRRLVQGRIDILRAELARRRDPEAPVEDAAVVVSSRRSWPTPRPGTAPPPGTSR